MVHEHGDDFTPRVSDPLTIRTFEVFFEVLRVLVTAGVRSSPKRPSKTRGGGTASSP